MICPHALTEFCACLARRPVGYLVDPPELKPAGQRDREWSCQCRRPDGRPLLRNHRHTEPWQCLPLEDVLGFKAAHPEIKTVANARRLAWLHWNFG